MDNSNLFPESAPDFSDPLGLLRACHRRIEGHCDTLLKLADHIESNGVDGEARKAAGNIYRYFTRAAPHHHADEEQDIFPRLVRQSLKLAETIHALKKQHEELDAAWRAVEPYLERPGDIEDAAEFRRLAQTMSDAYRAHIETEENDLLEIASHILSSDDLKQIGYAMAERRGTRAAF